MTLEERWNAERRLYRLPNTHDARLAFYAGARSVLAEVVDSIQERTLVDELEGDLLRLNDELKAFADATTNALA